MSCASPIKKGQLWFQPVKLPQSPLVNMPNYISNPCVETPQQRLERVLVRPCQVGGFPDAAHAPGLSTYQSQPRHALGASEATFAKGGTYARLKTQRLTRGSLPGLRGNITRYTPAARRNLLRSLASINQNKVQLPLFVTLTYPGDWDDYHEPVQWKNQLNTFQKRLTREYPDHFGIWKLEPQLRGAPHFHLAIYGIDNYRGNEHAIHWWFSKAWYEIIGSGQTTHLLAGTQVQLAVSWHGVAGYVGKYFAKTYDQGDLPECWQSPGKLWGKLQWDKAPVEMYNAKIGKEDTAQVRRIMRKFQTRQHQIATGRRLRYRSAGGISLYLNDYDFERFVLTTCTKDVSFQRVNDGGGDGSSRPADIEQRN